MSNISDVKSHLPFDVEQVDWSDAIHEFDAADAVDVADVVVVAAFAVVFVVESFAVVAVAGIEFRNNFNFVLLFSCE